LTDPKFKDGDALKTFDFVVANPPFSDKHWSTGLDLQSDLELDLWFSGLGRVRLEFQAKVDIRALNRIIAERVL